MKTTRIIERIKEFLAERPRSTREIVDHINETTRHGTSMNQAVNVLAKNKVFERVGHTTIRQNQNRYGSYNQLVWGLRDNGEVSHG